MECPDVEHCRDPIYKAINERVKWFHLMLLISLLGTAFAYWNTTISGAQEKADAATTKIEQESRSKDEKQDEEIKDLQIAVKGIEGKIDNALKEADRKQQETLEAIKDLKKDE